MVANYRCNELKEEALQAVSQQVDSLEKTCMQSVCADFKDQCQAILKSAVGTYTETARQYDRNVFKKIQKELADQLLQNMYRCFDSQMK